MGGSSGCETKAFRSLVWIASSLRSLAMTESDSNKRQHALERRILNLNLGGFPDGEVCDSLLRGGDLRCQSLFRWICENALPPLLKRVTRGARRRLILKCRFLLS